MSTIGEALRIQVLILWVNLDTTMPGLAYGKLKVVGFAGPFEDPALVLCNVAAAKAEEHSIDGRRVDGVKNE